MRTKASNSKNDLKASSTNDEKSDVKSKQDHSETEFVQVYGKISENEMIKSKAKFHPSTTRHILAIMLVIAILITILFFSILYAVAEKEVIERLESFSRYSITILSSLTGVAIGFFFGRDFKE